MAEFSDAHRRLAHLITSGAYVAGRLPSERALGESLGISRTTVRKVLAQLEQDGVLARSSTRRAQIARSLDGTGSMRRIAFIAPAFTSAGTGHWEDGLRRALAAHPGAHLSSLRYRSGDDLVFAEAARGYDGVFVLMGAEGADERVREALIGPGLAPVVSLEQDLSRWGVPSLRLFPPTCVHRVLDEMHALGHRRIGCLNTQPEDSIIAADLQAWQVWMAARGCRGPLLSEPIAPFGDPMPKAHVLMGRALADHPEVTAWLCLTLEAVRGAIRAVHDAGMVAGREVSLCSIDGQGQEDYLVPSLACIATVDPTPYLAIGLDWMLAGQRRPWPGALHFTPVENRFHPGESLGPVRAPATADRDLVQV